MSASQLALLTAQAAATIPQAVVERNDSSLSYESAATLDARASPSDDNDWSEDNSNYFEYAAASAWNPAASDVDSIVMDSIGNVISGTWRQGSVPPGPWLQGSAQTNGMGSYNSSTQIIFTHSNYNSLSNASASFEGMSSQQMPVSSAYTFVEPVEAKDETSSNPVDDALGRCHSAGSSSCDSEDDMPAGQRAIMVVTLPGKDSTTLLEVKPRPRRRKFGKGGKHSLGGRPNRVEEGQAVPIQLTAALLRQHFAMPLHDAARALGICATAVKKVCRKMGIKQWPFQRLKPIQGRLAKLRMLHRNRTRTSGTQGAAEMALEIKQLEAQESILLLGFDDDAR